MTTVNTAAQDSAARAVADAYLEAFEARDLTRCLALFADDARLDFQLATFQGPDQIAGWHRDRFAANLKLVRVENIVTRGDTVVIDAVASSDRLSAWNIPSLNGRVTLRLASGRIVEARFAARMMNPIDLIRSGD